MRPFRCVAHLAVVDEARFSTLAFAKAKAAVVRCGGGLVLIGKTSPRRIAIVVMGHVA